MQIKPPITILLSTWACLMVASAQTGTWNTVTTPSSWETNSNWSGNIIASGSDNSANFNQLDITADTTVNLTTPRVIGNLNFDDTNTTTAGSWILSGGSNTLTLAGTSPAIYVDVLGANKAATINAQLLGTSGFTKTGGGMLVLGHSTNTISGTVALAGGTLQYAAAGSLGTGSLSFTGNATLQAGAAATVDRAMNVASEITATYDTNGLYTNFSGALTGTGTFAKGGPGELRFTGGEANTLTGPIRVDQGRLAIFDGSSHKNMTGTITVASGASFFYGQSFSVNNLTNNVNISGPGDGTYGAFTVDLNANTYGTITLDADATISHGWNDAFIHGPINGTNKNLTLSCDMVGHGPLAIHGDINLDTGSLIKTGVNRAVLLGNNTFGSAVVSNGALYFEDAAAFGVTGANIKVEENGVAVLYGSNIQNLIPKIHVDSTGLVAFESSVTTSNQAIDMSTCPSLGFGAVADMTYSGTISGNTDYRFGGYNCTLTVSSPLSGAKGLIINNTPAGTVVLTGSLSYTGATVVKKGTLRMTGALSGGITVESPGSLKLSPNTATGTIATSQAFVSNGTLTMRLNRGQTQKSDRINAASIALSGTLTIVNEGAPIQTGDSFQLFSATGGITKTSLNIVLPALSSGLSWDSGNLFTTGVITATGVSTNEIAVGDPSRPDLLFGEMQNVYNNRATNGATSIRINPGTYHMPKLNSWENSFWLNGWQDFTINAENVLITLDVQRGFALQNANNVTIKGCTIRGRLISSTEGRITKKGTNPDGTLWAEWQISAGYPANFIRLDPSKPYTGMVQQLHSLNIVDQNTRYVNQVAGDNYWNEMTPLGNNKWKIEFNRKDMPFNEGDWLVTRADVYQTHAIYLDNSTNCTIDGVTSQGGSFATFYEYAGGGNKLINCKIECTPVAPPNGDEPPVVSCAADGVHSRDSYPGLHIENFTTTGVLLDDIIAIHGFFVSVVESTGNNRIRVVPPGGLNRPIGMIKVGDPVRIYHENGYFAQANCTAADASSGWITLDNNLLVPSGSVCSNPKYDGSDYKIINCNLKGSRSRAIIAKADGGLISGNSISESQTAVRMGADYELWESGWSWNTLIENNHIYNCRDAINMNADGSAVGNRNLTIRNNVFGDTILHCMYIAGTDGVTISGNKFGRTNLAEIFDFHFSTNVNFSNNLVEYSSGAKPFIKGAANVTNMQGQNNGILFSGRAYALNNVLSGHLLANPSNNAVGGTVQQYTECNASGRWILQSNGSGHTKILSAANGLALGVNNSTSAGSSLVLETQGNGDGQLWTLEPSGATQIKLVNKLSGLHATVASTTLGETVKQAASTTSNGQRWTPSFNDYSYATWRSTSGVGADLYADDDNDGLSNIKEYAFGTDLAPGVRPTREGFAMINVDSVTNNYGILEVRRRANATDVSLTVLCSKDLVTWTPGAVLVSSVNNPDGTVTEIWREPTPKSDRGFLRVMLNPPN